MSFLFFLLLFSLSGCRSLNHQPLQYSRLKRNFDEKSLYQFFSQAPALQEAAQFYKVENYLKDRKEAAETLVELAPTSRREKLKKVFSQFSATYPPSVPIWIAEGKYKGKKAFILVEIWASGKEKSFKRVRLWVFDADGVNLLYALSFKKPS